MAPVLWLAPLHGAQRLWYGSGMSAVKMSCLLPGPARSGALLAETCSCRVGASDEPEGQQEGCEPVGAFQLVPLVRYDMLMWEQLSSRNASWPRVCDCQSTLPAGE